MRMKLFSREGEVRPKLWPFSLDKIKRHQSTMNRRLSLIEGSYSGNCE